MNVSADTGGFRPLHVDVLVLGAGIAGTRAALAAHQAGASVAIVYLARGASPYVIGANVPLGHEGQGDSPAQYASDILEGGYHLSDKALVESMTQQSVAAFEMLAKEEIHFAQGDDGFRQRHLSGNMFARSVYVPDGTGHAMIAGMDRALNQAGVVRLPSHEVMALLKDGERVIGAVAMPKQGIVPATIYAQSTVLAMGGIGRLYDESTYPADINGDGLMLALQAGAKLTDMEFVQFEPVVTYHPEGAQGMEMPTAMLGEGAHLLNNKGERFMLRHNPGLGERGIEKARMALCIAQEVAEGRGLKGGTVRFDTTVMRPDDLESYVNHCKRLRKAGLDPSIEGPLVKPAAHSIMGGVLIDVNGETSVPGLFACGEVTSGIHGASRIAGNGAGEAMAMGWIVGRAAAAEASLTSHEGNIVVPKVAARALGHVAIRFPSLCADYDENTAKRAGASHSNHAEQYAQALATITTQVREIMSSKAGLYRDVDGLTSGLQHLKELTQLTPHLPAASTHEEIMSWRTQGTLELARMVISAALMREESRGAHQRTDHPKQDDVSWRCHIIWSLNADGKLVAEKQIKEPY